MDLGPRSQTAVVVTVPVKEIRVSDRKWKTEPLEKFADVISPEEYRKERIRRHLPDVLPYHPTERTKELERRRETDISFRIKRAQ